MHINSSGEVLVMSFDKLARVMFVCTVAGCLFSGTIARADDDGAILNPTVGSSKYQATKTTDSDSIKLQGNGRQASDKFNLESVLVVFKVANEGDSNFVV